MRMASRRKKNNFTGSETEILLSEIQKRKSVIFSSVISGIAGPAKVKKAITSAVNSMSPVVRNVTEIKKKWFDMKMAQKTNKKKSLAMGRHSMTATKVVQSVVAVRVLVVIS